MTFLDMIEMYNLMKNKPLDEIGSMFEDIDIDERVDKDILVGALLDECGAMRCLYETTATFKYFSDNFFKKYKWNITKLLDTLELKYDPIKNVNLEWTETTMINQDLATEEEANENRTKQNTGTQTNANTGTQTNASNETENVNNTGTQSNGYTGEQTDTVSAMNSSDYEPDRHVDISSVNIRSDDLASDRTDDISSTRTDNLTETRTDDLNENIISGKDRSKNENLTWNEEDKHIESGYKEATVQDLISKERKIAEFSIYRWISRKYAKELFLLVY